MKLKPEMVEQALGQIDAQAIPDGHPVTMRLSELFGDHTFFLDAEGLSIVEPVPSQDSGAQTGKVVKLASWNDEGHTSLAPHEPEMTDMVVVLEKAA